MLRLLHEQARLADETRNHARLKQFFDRWQDVADMLRIATGAVEGIPTKKARKRGSAWWRAHAAFLRSGIALTRASDSADRAWHLAGELHAAACAVFDSELSLAHAALDLAVVQCGIGIGATTEAEVRLTSGRTRSADTLARIAERDKAIETLASRAGLSASAIGARRASDVGLSADRLARKIRAARKSGASY